MFYLNQGYRWALAPEIERLEGVILLASANTRARLERSRGQDFSRVLFDPQLYLAGLDAGRCSKACARLASYPWFGVEGIGDYDSSTQKRRDWEKAARAKVGGCWPGTAPEGDDLYNACEACIELQLQLSCSQIILPSTLITEREDEAQAQAEWLDTALSVIEALDVGQPILATVAVADTALNDAAFEPNGFLDTITDQVTAREGLDGVYILVTKVRSEHPFQTDVLMLRAYMRMCQVFGQQGYSTVLANFCDVFGLVGRAFGATSFGTGPSQALRQVCLTAFQDEGYGIALPHFYSHPVIGEFRTEEDLDRIVAARQLRRVRDLTTYSRPLLNELSRHGTAGNLPDWAEAQNNLRAAHRHFIARLVAAERAIRKMTPDERVDAVREWLEDAAVNGEHLRGRLAPETIRGRLAPAGDWLELFDAELEE